jgi:VanZ like protein
MAEASGREAADRRLALRLLLLALYLDALFSTIPVVRPWSDALVRAGAPSWLLAAVGVGFAAVVLGMALRRRGALPVALAAALYAVIVAYLRAIPNEIVHLAEYGGLGLLVRWVVALRAGPAASRLAIALTAAIGFLDEWTQGATPGRFFDWHDVIVNAASGAVPIALLAPREEP